MTLLTTATKGMLGAKGAKGAAKHPGIITKGTKAVLGAKAVQGAAKHPGIITKGAKAALGVKAAGGAAKHPGVVRLGLKAGKPVARRKIGEGIGQVERFGEAAREVGETVLVGSALLAPALGLVEQPKPKPTAPLVAAGVVIGASAVYFLEPERGRERREKLRKLRA